MNNLMAALLERMAAVWIERIAGSKLTTIAGVLGIVATAVAQLAHFIPPSYCSFVTLAGVVLAGTAAILARDSARPIVSGPTTGTTTAKLGAWALIALLLPAPFVTGCSKESVAQGIINWTPMLQSAVATVDTSASILSPADAAIFAAATVSFDALSNELVAQAKAYLANPNATVLEQLQTAVVTFQQSVNTALLSAARIKDSASQQHAMTAIGAVSTAVNAVLALVQSVSSKAALAQMSAASTVKLAQVAPLLPRGQAVAIVAAHYDEPVAVAQVQVAIALDKEESAGF